MNNHNASPVYIADLLKGIQECRVFYHVKPDGDAIGSAHALALALQSIGANCQTVCSDPVPDIYMPLVGQVPVQIVNPECCINISVDCAKPQRLGKYQDEHIDICIDHHENNSIQAATKYVVDGSVSCAELIYEIILAMGVPVTPLMADLLYTGVLTDASCFRSVNTRPETLMHAAQIAAHGAHVADIGRRHFLKKSPGRIKIEQILQNHFHYSCNGRILGSVLTMQDYQDAGIGDDETEGLNEIMDQADGTDMAIVIRETRPHGCRVSVRANSPYSAVPVCAGFGGGGHDHAAGCTITGNPGEVLTRVEEACAAYLADHDNLR